MAGTVNLAIPRKYVWLVIGFVIGSYLGVLDLADLIGKIGGDVKGAVLEPSPVASGAPRSPARPSALRFYRTPEVKA